MEALAVSERSLAVMRNYARAQQDLLHAQEIAHRLPLSGAPVSALGLPSPLTGLNGRGRARGEESDESYQGRGSRREVHQSARGRQAAAVSDRDSHSVVESVHYESDFVSASHRDETIRTDSHGGNSSNSVRTESIHTDPHSRASGVGGCGGGGGGGGKSGGRGERDSTHSVHTDTIHTDSVSGSPARQRRPVSSDDGSSIATEPHTATSSHARPRDNRRGARSPAISSEIATEEESLDVPSRDQSRRHHGNSRIESDIASATHTASASVVASSGAAGPDRSSHKGKSAQSVHTDTDENDDDDGEESDAHEPGRRPANKSSKPSRHSPPPALRKGKERGVTHARDPPSDSLSAVHAPELSFASTSTPEVLRHARKLLSGAAEDYVSKKESKNVSRREMLQQVIERQRQVCVCVRVCACVCVCGWYLVY